ncbi:MAG TPA: DUF2794 domain-containing protein [Methylomirabilota bacterium]|nr:DUF2794 domain-containing protein [Methylomirabilota bacterium]
MTDEAETTATSPAAKAAPALRTLQTVEGRSSGPPAAGGGEREKPYTAFDRRELSEILKIYGRMVAAGEWRDYAIDHLADRAVFSIFRRTSEVPLYRIEKNPRLARRQGAYAVITQTGMILKRGPDLARVLRVIDKSLTLVEA